MNLTKINQTALEPTAKEAIRNAVRGSYYSITEKPIVFCNILKNINQEDCKALGYDICEGLYGGGVLVSNKGDLVFISFNDNDNGLIQGFCESLVEWLKSRGLNATLDNNDVLVDGYKVCGTVVSRYGYIDFSGAFVAVDVNLDHIKQICKKQMVKVPKGLADFGVTSEELEEWFSGHIHGA